MTAGGEIREVGIRDDSIRLAQFLKLADLIDHGGEARPLIAGGGVRVNGEVEARRGRQLRPGDVVSLGDVQVRVVTGGSPGGAADSLPW